MQQHERLKSVRIEHGFRTGTEAAKAMGVSVATYNSHENGHRALTLRAAEQYGKFFTVRPSWLLTGEEPQRFARSIDEMMDWQRKEDAEASGAEWGAYVPGSAYRGTYPGITPEVDGSETSETGREVTGEWMLPADYVEVSLGAQRHQIFLLAVPDDTMAPALQIGDRAIVDATKTSFSGNGHYAIQDDDGQLHIRQIAKVVLKKLPEEEISVSTNNPAVIQFARLSDVHIIGRVIGKICKMP